MISTTATAAIREFRSFLDQEGYDTPTLIARLGRAYPPSADEQRQMFDDSREVTTLNVLIRLFLLGAPVDTATIDEFLPGSIVRFCRDSGLLHFEEGGAIVASVVIIPVEDLLFASDAFRRVAHEDAADFVLPASAHAANFLRLLTCRNPVDTMLDLGCGCGIHALFAARHAVEVVATDVSATALSYTRFNAALNDIANVSCLEGSLFEPVAGRTFDLIVSNPPFVLSPESMFTYRDNPLDLDDFCRLLISEAPEHLNEHGRLQMLCELVDLPAENWEQRLTDWLAGCDAWILHAAPLSPAAYVARRSTDIRGDGVDSVSTRRWQSYLESHAVKAIHPVALTLRRRAGSNWLHVQNIAGDIVTPAGTAIASGIEAVDFLEACDDISLGQAMFGLADELSATRTADGEIQLRLNNGLGTEAEIDRAVAAFLNLFNGRRSVDECIASFAAATEADDTSLRRDLLAIVRVFVSRGFLAPLDP